MMRVSGLLLVVIVLSAWSFAGEPPPGAADVRASVERSLGFVEKTGVAWLDDHNCIACHHGAWMIWSFNEARRAGIAVDAKRLDTLTSRVETLYLSLRSGFEKEKKGWVESTYMAMSRDGYDVIGTGDSTWRTVAAAQIATTQQPNGTWKYFGQLLERPPVENDESTTLWALLALPAGPTASTTEAASRDKALTWIKENKPGASLDAAALRLAVALHFGDTAQAAGLKDNLLARQSSDGGWQWSEHRASDAFATGEAIYVLSLAGVKNDSPAIQKAWSFLVKTQQPDGSWACHSRKVKGGTEVASYWGTAWATIGLARTLGPAPR